jgi:hypothetical protein
LVFWLGCKKKKKKKKAQFMNKLLRAQIKRINMALSLSPFFFTSVEKSGAGDFGACVAYNQTIKKTIFFFWGGGAIDCSDAGLLRT